MSLSFSPSVIIIDPEKANAKSASPYIFENKDPPRHVNWKAGKYILKRTRINSIQDRSDAYFSLIRLYTLRLFNG